MGKKNKKKKKHKAKDYEGYQYGPLRLERFGRYVRMSSQWEPGEYKKFQETVRSKRPELRDKINKTINELITIVEQNDPFELLTTIAYKNCFADPENYSESSHDGRECYVEFALSLITGHSKPGFGKHNSKKAIDKFNELISVVFNHLLWYFGTEKIDIKGNNVEDELRYRSILRYIFLRGDSYQEHHVDLIVGLFTPHDHFLKNSYGFTTYDLIEGIKKIESQVLGNYNRIIDGMIIMKEQHDKFKKFIDTIEIDKYSSIDKVMKDFRELPDTKNAIKKLDNFQNILNGIPFEIQPNNSSNEKLFDLLSLKIGENKDFLTFYKSPGWPTNDSKIYLRPIIKHDGRFYLFMPQLPYRSLGNILESWIKQKDKKYFDEIFQKKRAKYLEEKAIEYIKALLPGSKVYRNLYYRIDENGIEKRIETDGIILYDTNLFIFEGKAGELSLSARRGGIDRLKNDIEELINSAYGQALRTLDYIKENENPDFEYQDGSQALTITNKSMIDNIFLVNVTLENLGDLSTHLNSLKRINLIKGEEWPWSVFINDLRVISEIVDSPSQFLTFLKRRLRANDFPQFNASDELDFLMFFLREGLYFEDFNKKDKSSFTPHAYTEPLDRYYDYLGGRVSTGEKPTLRTSPEFKRLVQNIENLGKDGFTRVTTTLLDFSGDTHKQIIESLNHLKKMSNNDGKTHDVTFYFKESSIGVTFFIGPYNNELECTRMKDHCELKMYQTKYRKWFAIATDSAGDIVSPYDFFIFKKGKWVYDDSLEQKLRHFKKHKWQQSHQLGKKVGRNQPCPCGSGLKFKKCCGR